MRQDPPAFSDEWVGGYFTLDSLVTGEGPPYRPSLVVWMDPAGFALKGTPVRPGEELGALVRLLAEACARPEVGPPRRPARVRVADEVAARRIRERHGIPVQVGQTPELDDLRRSYAEYLARQQSEEAADPTYLPDGFSPAELADLFTQARALYTLAPWKHMDDEDVLAVDVPAHSVRAAVLSLIGGMDETLGFALFESAEAFRQFLSLNESGLPDEGAPDFGGEMLTLTFERRDDLPELIAVELAEHRLRATGGGRYPVVLRRSRTGEPMPTTAADLRLATATAAALVALFQKHPPGRGLPVDGAHQVSGRGGLAVTLTHPHPQMEPPAEGPVDPDIPVVDQVFGFGAKRFPEALEEARRVYGLGEHVDPLDLQLFVPWFAFCYRVDGGEPLAARFLRERGADLDAGTRTWLERQLDAPLSIWEVEAIQRGQGMTLRDLLTGRCCRVLDRKASESATLRDGLLGRVVADEGSETYGLHGLHPRALPPRATAAVVAELVRRAAWESLPVDSGRLAGSNASELLVELWRTQLAALAAAPAPQLHNTDGDPLLMVKETYDLDGRRRSEVVAALRRGGFEAEGKELTLSKYKRGGPLETVLVATVKVQKGQLIIETNSRRRASAAARKVKAALGGDLRRLGRTETDPPVPSRSAGGPPPARDVPAEALDIIRKLKADHWRRWLDEPIPALGGATPRQAARAPDRRDALELLLKEAERAESIDHATAFDVSVIRQELGLA